MWLDRLDEAQEAKGAAGRLCRRHADSMVVPIGWSLDDRRQPVPRLFVPSTAEDGPVRDVTAPTPRPARGKRRRADQQTSPSLFDLEPGEATVAEHRSEPVDDATPWRPVFDTGDDLGGLLAAKTPLLARAFRGEAPGRRDR